MRYGERIRLRAMEREDLPHFVRWLNDPEVTTHLVRFWPLSLAEETRWFERLMARPEWERPLVIEARQPDGSWEPIGNCAFHHIDWRNRSAEVGIVIGERAFWDQGYGTEALVLLLDLGFAELNLHRIALQVTADNHRALAAYRKLGFIEEGRLRQAVYRRGCYTDMLMMSILRPEWDAQRTTGTTAP